MPDLPGDIVEDILLLLPTKSICRFNCVCKQWRNLIENPGFTKRRLKHSIETEELDCLSIKDGSATSGFPSITKFSSLYSVFEDDHPEHVQTDSLFSDWSEKFHICSYDGLILIIYLDDWKTVLWNLYTKTCRDISTPEVMREGSYAYGITYGIGYSGDTNNFSILVATCYIGVMDGDRLGLKVQVYAPKSDSWKTIRKTFPYEVKNYDQYHNDHEAVFVHGAFHWIVNRLRSKKTADNKICIVSYDVRGETFKEVAVSRQVDKLLNNGIDKNKLGVLGGCLCILRAHDDTIEVWVKKDNVVSFVTATWTRLFIVRPPVALNSIDYVKILWELKNGEVLFETTKVIDYDGPDYIYWSSHIDRCLVLYDPVGRKCLSPRSSTSEDTTYRIQKLMFDRQKTPTTSTSSKLKGFWPLAFSSAT